MNQNLKIVCLKGPDIMPFIPELARLRIDIFRAYPYLYDGDLEYEHHYLNTYVKCSESIMVVVLDQGKVVGASSAIPLEFETINIKKPFLDNVIPIKDVFYFGESVLQVEYRGCHIYRHFFAQREASARKYGCKVSAFAAIEREFNDPRRLKMYTPLDGVWSKFGYKKHPELCAYFEWKEIDEQAQTSKPMVFWLKKL